MKAFLQDSLFCLLLLPLLFDAIITAAVPENVDLELVRLLKDGGYFLNAQEKTVELVQNELDRLRPALEIAISQLKNESLVGVEKNGVDTLKSPLVFQVGLVVKEKVGFEWLLNGGFLKLAAKSLQLAISDFQKLMRRIDFIRWARQIGLRALALGKRYVGVSFEMDAIRCRFYLFFVEETELAALEVLNGRTALSAEIRELFERLKHVSKDRV